MENNATQILDNWRDGLIRENGAILALEAINVRGAFDSTGYTGYDYANQKWITAPYPS